MEAEIDGVRISIVQGDITEVKTDAIVNAANNHLWMGGGVAGAIKRAGGGNIETEAMSKGPIPIGQSVVTAAGKLETRYVIHAAVMGQDLQTSAEAIRNATRSSLERACELGIRSLAFPAFGTGVGGFALAASAAAMIDESISFLREWPEKKLLHIFFVLFSADLCVVFEKHLSGMLSPP